jgi:HSP20 family molecular chaperone IbpA
MIMVQNEPKTKNTLRITQFRNSEESMPNRRKRVMVTPAANVDETNNEYILTIASPGFKRENFQVIIEKDFIAITASKEASMQSCIHDRCEYDYNRWKRDFLLPEDADALLTTARYKDGELIIRIPKGKSDNLSGITNIYVY